MTDNNEPRGIAFGEAVRIWLRIALLSFGGPAGQIAVMHRIGDADLRRRLCGTRRGRPGGGRNLPLAVAARNARRTRARRKHTGAVDHGYAGFLGAYRHPGTLSPLLAGPLGGLLTTWVTFVPCFLWIFIGAPFVERLRENRALAVATITAAVVGVILNLAFWFALNFWFGHIKNITTGPVHLPVPDPATVDLVAIALSATAMVAILRFKFSVFAILRACATLGLLIKLFWHRRSAAYSRAAIKRR